MQPILKTLENSIRSKIFRVAEFDVVYITKVTLFNPLSTTPQNGQTHCVGIGP